MSFRQFVEELIGRENTEKFCLWAFGKGWKNRKIEDFLLHWNMLHGDLLTLKPESLIAFDVPKMIKFWRAHKTS